MRLVAEVVCSLLSPFLARGTRVGPKAALRPAGVREVWFCRSFAKGLFTLPYFLASVDFLISTSLHAVDAGRTPTSDHRT